MRVEAWRDQGRFFDFRGHRVFYRDCGAAEGEVILCIHGFPTASWDFHAILPHLQRDFRVVTADMLGFGFSDKPRDLDYTIALQADLQVALLDRLAIERCFVIAHDYGDTVVQELLARDLEGREDGTSPNGPQYLAVVLLNGGLFPETHRPRPIQRLLASPLGGLVARQLDERRFRRSFRRVFGPDTQPTDDDLAQYWSLISHQQGQRLAHRLIRYMGERRRFRDRWVGALQRTQVPLLLVDGALDPVSGAHMAERYREVVGKPVRVLSGVGHYPQIEDAPNTASAAREFFQSLA